MQIKVYQRYRKGYHKIYSPSRRPRKITITDDIKVLIRKIVEMERRIISEKLKEYSVFLLNCNEVGNDMKWSQN